MLLATIFDYLPLQTRKEFGLWGNHRKSRPQIYFDFDLHIAVPLNNIVVPRSTSSYSKRIFICPRSFWEIGCVVPGNWKECWMRRCGTYASIHHRFGDYRFFHPPWYVLYTASAFPDQPVQSGKSAINNPQPGRGVVSPSPPTKYVEKSEKRRVRQ